MRAVAVLLLTSLLMPIGCRRADPDEELTEMIRGYGQLPGLSATQFPPLRDEWTLVADELATPVLLEADSAEPVVEESRNAAAGLKTLFTDKQLKRLDRLITQHYPVDRFQFDPITLENAVRLVADHAEQRDRFHEAIQRPECRWSVEHTRGLTADLWMIDTLRVATRLEAFAAADVLADDQPLDAIAPLRRMFRAAELLGRIKRVGTRMAAAHLRSDALLVVEAVVQHPAATTTVLQQVDNLISAQLRVWPPDADAWIGDRAVGLHTYEMVRDGQLLSVLTDEEIRKLRSEDRLAAMVEAVARNVDGDELFYLQTMRRVVAACEHPYYQRREMFAQLHRELDEASDSAAYPVFAAHFLLPPIEQHQAAIARDRARCDGWSLAVSAALDRSPEALPINPLTGKPYELQRDEHRIVVRGVDEPPNNWDLIVPLPQDKLQSSAGAQPGISIPGN